MRKNISINESKDILIISQEVDAICKKHKYRVRRKSETLRYGINAPVYFLPMQNPGGLDSVIVAWTEGIGFSFHILNNLITWNMAQASVHLNNFTKAFKFAEELNSKMKSEEMQSYAETLKWEE